MFHSVNDGVLKQSSFFRKNRPHQPVLRDDVVDFDVEKKLKENRKKIKSFKSKYGWKRNYPNVYERAEATNYTELYDFLYAATSRAVHFEPGLLLRMGWTDKDIKGLDPEEQKKAEYKFTTENFQHFYQLFCEFYSVYLFSHFCSDFGQTLKFESDFFELVDELEASLDNYHRWPEIITFEEMNIKKPSDIIYILSNAMHGINEE